jgi:putative phosphoesterase
MRIAILSDTHSNYATVEAAVKLADQRRAELLLHCGDIDDTETVGLFSPNTHFVFGNCDNDRASLRLAIQSIGATLHEPYGNLELAGSRLAFVHGDHKRLMNDLEHRGAFDYVFYGHTHQAAEHRTGSTRVINPGALQRARVKTFIILDLATGELQPVIVE